MQAGAVSAVATFSRVRAVGRVTTLDAGEVGGRSEVATCFERGACAVAGAAQAVEAGSGAVVAGSSWGDVERVPWLGFVVERRVDDGGCGGVGSAEGLLATHVGVVGVDVRESAVEAEALVTSVVCAIRAIVRAGIVRGCSGCH